MSDIRVGIDEVRAGLNKVIGGIEGFRDEIDLLARRNIRELQVPEPLLKPWINVAGPDFQVGTPRPYPLVGWEESGACEITAPDWADVAFIGLFLHAVCYGIDRANATTNAPQ